MNTSYRGAARRDEYGSRIDREHSPWRAQAIPYLSIILGSLIPGFVIATAIPLMPPLALMLLVGWRLVRPGIFPVWVGFPLGLFDDLFSGNPFGSAILLFSMAMLAIEAIELRFPWHGFLQDWMTASLIISSYLFSAALLSGAAFSPPMFLAIGPQLLLSVLLFPIVARMIARMDRLRLMRVRTT